MKTFLAGSNYNYDMEILTYFLSKMQAIGLLWKITDDQKFI